MNLLKKTTALILSLVLICSISVFAADNKVTFTASNVSGKVGETVEIKVDISNNSGVSFIEIENHYDQTALEYTGYEINTLLSMSAFVVDRDPADDMVKFTWGAATVYSNNENIYTLKFKILKEGTYTVEPRLISLLNFDENDVPADMVNGSVTGTKDPAQTTVTTTTNTTTTTETTTQPTTQATTKAPTTQATTKAPTTQMTTKAPVTQATTQAPVVTTESQSEGTTAAVIETSSETTTRKTTSSGGGGGGGGTIRHKTTVTTTEATTETTTVAKSDKSLIKDILNKDEKTTETETKTTKEDNVISKEVRVSIGSNIISVGSDKFTVDAAPYIQTESSSTLIPLRFAAIAISGESVDNADTSSIIGWDAATKTATVKAKGKTVSFTAGSNAMIIDGKPVTMDNGVKAEIKDGRMYIPFRALGTALGVKVDWDANTKTAIFSA